MAFSHIVPYLRPVNETIVITRFFCSFHAQLSKIPFLLLFFFFAFKCACYAPLCVVIVENCVVMKRVFALFAIKSFIPSAQIY